MRVPVRRAGIAAFALAAVAGGQPQARAQVIEPTIDCGPFRVFPGDLVHVNVGNTGSAAEELVIVHVGVLDENGAPLLERTITLAPGHSRSASVTMADGGLVRGRVRVMSGPENPQLRATMQGTRQQRFRLTYGPNFECAGPTASRGPV
jgi:hypothetical protein